MIPEVTIDIDDSVLLEALSEIRWRTWDVMTRLVEDVATEILQNAWNEAPVRTGRLRRNIYAERTDNLQFKVAANKGGGAPYSIYVHEGTRFMKANPFLLRAAVMSVPFISRRFREAVAEAVAPSQRRIRVFL